MNLNEINFTFAGKHCLRDFGCTYIESGGHAISPKINRNSYKIPGLSGSVSMPGKTLDEMPMTGILVFEESPPSQADAQEQLRRITAWLTQGRDRLTFDYEPNRYYLAEVTSQTNWTYASWIDGELGIQFNCQPFAYSRSEHEAKATTTSYGATLTLTMATGEPAPLQVDIKNTGAAPITGITITAGDKQAKFTRSLSVAAGRTFRLNMEAPAGATIDSADAMPTCTLFEYITARAGLNTITVALNYGSGTRSATIRAHARGRY